MACEHKWEQPWPDFRRCKTCRKRQWYRFCKQQWEDGLPTEYGYGRRGGHMIKPGGISKAEWNREEIGKAPYQNVYNIRERE